LVFWVVGMFVGKDSDGFVRVQVGDTKEQVLKQLGRPGEISACFHPSQESAFQRICAEEFWYYGFLERWNISFDKDGRVIYTNYNVSP